MNKRTIIITGASSGVGAALAKQFANDGVCLFLSARSESRLEDIKSVCEKAGAKVNTHVLDVTDTEAVYDWVSSIEANQSIDLAIANAGILETCPEKGEVESAAISLSQISTNLGGVINLATAVAKFMKERGRGQIVFIASLAAIQPISDIPGYSASKAGVVAYGEALNNLLYDSGVTVSVVCPGFIKTPMLEDFNNFRPFELSADTAAKEIIKSINKKKALYAFPKIIEVFLRLGRLLPVKLRRYTNKPFNFKH